MRLLPAAVFIYCQETRRGGANARPDVAFLFVLGCFFRTGKMGSHTCFLHRLGGMPEPRRRFVLTGGKFFAVPQRGVRRLRTAGTLRCPPRGQKGRDTCGFPSSLNSYLSLVGIAWVQTVDCVSRKRTRQSGYLSVSFSAFSQFTDSVLLHIRVNQRRARHDSAAQILGTLYRTAPTNLDVWYNLSS